MNLLQKSFGRPERKTKVIWKKFENKISFLNTY